MYLIINYCKIRVVLFQNSTGKKEALIKLRISYCTKSVEQKEKEILGGKAINIIFIFFMVYNQVLSTS